MEPRLSGERCGLQTPPPNLASRRLLKPHPRCWHCRSPAHGQCFLGPSSRASQDRSSITWLGAPKQRSRSMGLAEHTGKSRTGTTKTVPSPRGARGSGCMLDCTCMEGAAEVGAAVALAPAGAPGLSSGCVVAALTPHAQLWLAALLIHGTRLREDRKAFS